MPEHLPLRIRLLPEVRWLAILVLGLALALVPRLADQSATSTASAAPRAIHQGNPSPQIFLPLTFRRTDLTSLATPEAPPPASPTAEATDPPPTSAPTDTPKPTDLPPATQVPTAPPTPTLKPGYSEPLTSFPSLDDLRTGYRSDRWYPTLLEVLKRRYAHGHYVVTELDDSEGHAKEWVGSQNDTFDHLLNAANLTVHEMNHQLDWQEGLIGTRFQSHAYVVRDDLTLVVPRVQTFPRSEIAVYVVGPLDNFYRSTYLVNSGNEDFQNLVDELNAYTQALFVDYGLHDQFPQGQRRSARDGVVTMMMYTEFYLRHAREHHPADYAALQDKPEMREAIRLLWARAMFILEVTEDIGALSINAAPIEAEVRKPELMGEIDRFTR